MFRALALAVLVPHLPKALLPEALAAARTIERGDDRAFALAALAPQAPKVMRQALSWIFLLASAPYVSEVATALTRNLPKPLLLEALAQAREYPSGLAFVEKIAALARRLPDGVRQSALQEALAEVWALYDTDRWRALTVLAPHLPQMLVREALTASRAIRILPCRAYALAALALHLPEDERRPILREALAVGQSTWDSLAQAGAVAALVTYLPEDKRQPVLRAALTAMHTIEDEGIRDTALSTSAEISLG